MVIYTLSLKFFFIIVNPIFPPTWTTTLPSGCWDGYKLIHSFSHTKNNNKKISPPFFSLLISRFYQHKIPRKGT